MKGVLVRSIRRDGDSVAIAQPPTAFVPAPAPSIPILLPPSPAAVSPASRKPPGNLPVSKTRPFFFSTVAFAGECSAVSPLGKQPEPT